VGHRLALVDQALVNGWLVSNTLLLGLTLAQGDGEEVLNALEPESVKALLKGLVHLLEDLSLDPVHLVEALHSVLDDLCN